MNRRGFFGLFAGAAAAFALDPERALWTPGAKLILVISIPSVIAPPVVSFLGIDLVNGAMRMLGVLASGEMPNAEESADGLLVLQQILGTASCGPMFDIPAARLRTIREELAVALAPEYGLWFRPYGTVTNWLGLIG